MKELVAATGKAPGLAVVLVGARGDSETYVRSKVKACEEVGIESFAAYLPEDVPQEVLLKVGCECCVFSLLLVCEKRERERECALLLLSCEKERKRENRNAKRKKKALFYISSRAPNPERETGVSPRFSFHTFLRFGRICWSAIKRKEIGALSA